MAPQQNTYADISSLVNTIYEGSLMIAREQNVMVPLVRNFGDATGLAARKNTQYTSATMSSIGETDDLTSQAFTPSVIATLTPGEVGAQFFITDSRVESDWNNVVADASMELGEALASKFDTDLLGVFSSLTGGTVGAAGTTITWGHVFAMEARLKAQKAPYPYNLVLHPFQWHQLGKAASVAGTRTNASPDLLNNVNQMFFVQQVGGIRIFTSSNISIDTGTDAYCALFSQDAIGFDLRRAPRLERERDASRRGWELNMSAIYAFGVWRPEFGIQGIFDAATPTS